MLDGERPQSGVGDIQPMDCRIQHHCSGNCHDGSDVALGDAIVIVSADASKSNDLFKVGEVARELGRGECLGVVGKILLRHDSCVATHPFKSFLCLEGLVGVQTHLMLDKNEAGGVINKDTSSKVHVVKFGFAGGGE